MTDLIKKRRTLEGVVVSNKMNNSIVIQTARLVAHRLYGKMIRRHKKFMVDDPKNTCSVGDQVIIEECRPLSKNKRWRLLQIVKKFD